MDLRPNICSIQKLYHKIYIPYIFYLLYKHGRFTAELSIRNFINIITSSALLLHHANTLDISLLNS